MGEADFWGRTNAGTLGFIQSQLCFSEFCVLSEFWPRKMGEYAFCSPKMVIRTLCWINGAKGWKATREKAGGETGDRDQGVLVHTLNPPPPVSAPLPVPLTQPAPLPSSVPPVPSLLLFLPSLLRSESTPSCRHLLMRFKLECLPSHREGAQGLRLSISDFPTGGPGEIDSRVTGWLTLDTGVTYRY